MTSDPLVSIRCTVYNHEPFLRQCLDGFVMQQTSFPFEAIVHDDASTDGSAAIIREYAEKYPDIIKPIYEDENQWVKGTINKIMDAVMSPNSKYIAHCEGDDYWTDPHKLQLQVDFLESHPEYTMCFHGAKTIDDETGMATDKYPAETFKSIEDREYTSTELFQVWTVPTASMVYRRECLYYPLKKRYRILFGDIVRVLACAEIGLIQGMSRTMSVYRIHADSILHCEKGEQRFIKYSPEHYLFVKDNFPKVDNKVLESFISKRFWVRSLCEQSKKDSIKDLVLAFRYDWYATTFRVVDRFFPTIVKAIHYIKHYKD